MRAAPLVCSVALLGLAGDSVRAEVATPDAAPDVASSEHAEPVASYALRAKLDPVAHSLHGEGTIRWRNASTKPVSELWMHLYLNAFKNQSSVFMRAPIGGFRGAALPTSWGTIDVTKLTLVQDDHKDELTPEPKRGGDDDETDARIALPREIPAGAEVTLEVTWDDKLPSIVERTGFDGSFHMIAQWFPKLARIEPDGTFAHFPFHHLGEFYSDFGVYDVTLDVPEGFTIGATGAAVETKTEGGRRIERHVQADIHDFAWTAWDRFVVRKDKIAGVDVSVLTPPGYDDDAERELETLRFALPHFGARYGKYPYPVLTVVHPPGSAPEAGGMEYPTLITTGGAWWMPRGIFTIEGVTIHEFGHQWFYGLCASNEDAWPFLDEGLNTYAENEGLTAWKGLGSGATFAGLRIGDIDVHAEISRHLVHDEKVAQPAGSFASGHAYGGLVYGRTGTMLETLARVYGKPKLDRALGVYTRRCRFQHPTPNDLLAALRDEISPDAAENFRAAIFEKGWVDYAITAMSSHGSHGAAGIFDRAGKRETVTAESTRKEDRYDGWVLVMRRGTLHLPVDIELVAADDTRTRVHWDGEAESFRVPYSGTTPLRAAIVDPEARILADQDAGNNFATAPAQQAEGAPRVLERATFWAAAILGGLSP